MGARMAMVAMTAWAVSVAAQVPTTDSHVVVASARQAIRDRYVLPPTAEALDRALAAGEAAGRYRDLTGAALADRMSADLDAVAHDRHLSVRYDPAMAAMLGNAPADDDAPPPPEIARMMDRGNAGVRELRLLPGNIRYLAYDGFVWDTPGSANSVEAAMRFLRGGDAYIIDIRRNGGGDPGAVAALVSYFLPAGTPLMRFEMRGKPGIATQAPKAPFSLAGKPLYVLTSGRTASAAEEFSTHAKAYGFGTLVGTTTAGAGFRNDFVPLPGGYVLSVSVGRAVSLKTGKDWERVGVAPDIAASADAALAKAEATAMARITATAAPDERATDERLREYYQALAAPVPAGRPAAAYAGTYGPRMLVATADGLEVRRDGQVITRLVPVAADTFAPEVDPSFRYAFAVTGDRIASLRLVAPDGSAETVQRQ